MTKSGVDNNFSTEVLLSETSRALTFKAAGVSLKSLRSGNLEYNLGTRPRRHSAVEKLSTSL